MKDDFKDEYLPRLKNSFLYITLKEKCIEKDNEVIVLVEKIAQYAIQRTKTIVRHMGEFTLHDIEHLFRVLYLMEKILPKNFILELSVPELLLLVASAFMHDVGMAPNETEILIWKKVWDKVPDVSENDLKTFNEFKRYYYSRPDQIEIINKLIEQGRNSQVELIKSYLITEYIRRTHAERITEIIEQDWMDKIKFRDNDLTVELAQICLSHNEDAIKLNEQDKYLICGDNIYTCLPLIGIVLRLADILDFDAKRTPPILFSHLYVRDPVSLKEWNKHRAIEAWEISTENIFFVAKCNHPAIEASIHQFCDDIDQELSICNNLISDLNEFHSIRRSKLILKLPYKVSREKIVTKKNVQGKPIYIYKETQFNLSKRQVIELLMGTKLYGNPEVALRELIQNSIDACQLRRAQETKWGNQYIPEITISYKSEDGNNVLIVEDNGTGMDQYIIDNYYSKIGTSFYKSTDFYNLLSDTNTEFTPTSRFGIGILSSFMVADTLIVDTKRVYPDHKSSEAINLTVEGQDSIFWIKEGSKALPGTITKLVLRDTKNPWKDMTNDRFIKSVKNSIPNPPFLINIITETENSSIDENDFQSLTPTKFADSYYWKSYPNIKYLDISLNSSEFGIKGIAQVAILEMKGMPKKEIFFEPNTVNIDGEEYVLKKKVWIRDNRIDEDSTSITIGEDFNINAYDSTNILAKSKAKISLQGIEIPCDLFPDSWNKKENQAIINFPFPITLIVDICGRRDLDLNSSRTEIITTEKWYDFEEKLAIQICQGICEVTSKKYWNKFKNNCIQNSKNETFLRAIASIPDK